MKASPSIRNLIFIVDIIRFYPRACVFAAVSFISRCWKTSFSLICDSGSFGGGALLSVQGSGFDPHNSTVKICGEECEVHREMSTSSRLYCQSPFNNSEFTSPHFTGIRLNCHFKDTKRVSQNFSVSNYLN